MHVYQTDPRLFCLIVLSWPVIIFFFGAGKAFFGSAEDLPPEEAENEG